MVIAFAHVVGLGSPVKTPHNGMENPFIKSHTNKGRNSAMTSLFF
jgi:hypothetical protein